MTDKLDMIRERAIDLVADAINDEDSIVDIHRCAGAHEQPGAARAA